MNKLILKKKSKPTLIMMKKLMEDKIKRKGRGNRYV